MKKIITFILFIICIAFSCERDDICDEDTPTTPRLFVEFRDDILFDNPKNVTGLRVEDFDDDTRVLLDENSEFQMLLPIRTDAEETKFRVYKDYNILSDGTIEGNSDVITLTYSTSEIYVSRACGFKSIFENIVLTIEPDTENWMVFAAPENDNQSVTNENDIHYTIRH